MTPSEQAQVRIGNSVYSVLDFGTRVDVLRAKGRRTKHIPIIEELYKYKGDLVTASGFAKELHVSSDLVRKVLRGLRAEKQSSSPYPGNRKYWKLPNTF